MKNLIRLAAKKIVNKNDEEINFLREMENSQAELIDLNYLPIRNKFPASTSIPSVGIQIFTEIISLEEENIILGNCVKIQDKFIQLSGRQVAMFGGQVTRIGLKISNSDSIIPQWMKSIMRMVEGFVAELLGSQNDLNHVLVNRYLPGDGIFPHEDGPLYFPVVSILSVGSSCVMNFIPKYPKEENEGFNIFIPARSLFVFSGKAYTDYLHGIAFNTTDLLKDQGIEIPRAERYSFTIRHVPLEESRKDGA